jgi:trigger factor
LKVDYLEDGLCRRHLDFEIPPETVAEAFEQRAAALGRQLKLPGFRKGKIPKELVKSRFRSEILSEVAQDLVERALGRALQERSLVPLGDPEIDKLQIDLGQPLRFRASFEVLPAIEPRDYRGLPVSEPAITIDEAKFEERLESLRQRAARFDPISDRGARSGDYVLGRMQETPAGGKGPTRTQEGVFLELGAEVAYPGLAEKLEGVRPGEAVSFEASFPADHPDRQRAGRSFTVSFEVQELKEKFVPPLDDDLAKELGEFDSLAELKEQVRAALAEEAEREAEHDKRQQLIDRLLERNPFEPPRALVEHELDRRIEDLARQLISRGVDPQRAGIDWRGFREGQRASASAGVRASLILSRIADKEGLRETEEETAKEIERIAGEMGRSVESVRAQLLKDGGLDRLRGRLRRDKAIDFLQQNARIGRG